MYLHGYCTKCKRITRVKLTGSAAAFMQLQGIPVGVCHACETKR